MDAFDVCGACACYIKRREARCPFCDAVHVPAKRADVRLRSRVSRAQWLAYGATFVVAGCAPSATTAEQAADATTQDADSIRDATADSTSSVDAAKDRGDDTLDAWTSPGPPDGGAGSGTFACDYDRRRCGLGTEYCLNAQGPGGGCFGYDAGWDSQCDASSPCACIHACYRLSSCRDDDAGGLYITCSPCYGAPPARLEKLARAVS